MNRGIRLLIAAGQINLNEVFINSIGQLLDTSCILERPNRILFALPEARCLDLI